jgi:hypothetical protein
MIIPPGPIAMSTATNAGTHVWAAASPVILPMIKLLKTIKSINDAA